MTVKPKPERRAPTRLPDAALPHSIEAERALLGALTVNPSLLAMLPAGISSESFYRDGHRRLYAALTRLVEARQPVDPVTVVEELRRTGDLDAAGGPAYLASLTDGMPFSANAPAYAATVVDHATRRAVILLAQRIAAQAYEAESKPADLLEFASREMLQLATAALVAGSVTVASLIADTITALERAHGGHAMVTGVPTGFPSLDQRLGGLQPGNLILIAARPGHGKTALAMNIATYAGLHGHRVGVFSLEMMRLELMERMVCSQARVNSHHLRAGYLNEEAYARISHALSELAEMPVRIDDTAALPIGAIRTEARRMKVEMGGLALVVVDYLQLVSAREWAETRSLQVGFISSQLKAMAKELMVPVVALSQLTRDNERTHREPRLSDLRESGSLEQDADVVLFLHPEGEETPGQGLTVKVIVAKQRNGPTGFERLFFVKAHTRFEEATGATLGS